MGAVEVGGLLGIPQLHFSKEHADVATCVPQFTRIKEFTQMFTSFD
jgi:hypothetical protein